MLENPSCGWKHSYCENDQNALHYSLGMGPRRWDSTEGCNSTCQMTG